MKIALILAVLALITVQVNATEPAVDRLPTCAGDLAITFIGHGTLMFVWDGKVVHVDPWGRLADYAALPKADIILITHEHRDHLDPATIARLRKEDTVVVVNPSAAGQIDGSTVMTNGEARVIRGLPITAVAAYNLKHERAPGQPYHPRGNGYVFTFGDQKVYVAGDTENTPEMKALTDIACAFLPMNLPYTMTPEMVADAALAFRPRILYPYHFGETDPTQLPALLKDSGIEVRIRAME